MRSASPRTALALLIASVAAVKIFLQASVPGFLQGDDVETLESAFRAAFGLAYDDWEIRSHLLPELLVAPVLRAAALLPGIGTDGLLLAASLPFIVAGAIATLLVFRLARAWSLSENEALVAAVVYAVHAIPVAYGIGGFPRVLVAPLIVGAALLATRGTALGSLLAGLLVGIAGAARYSEWMFLLPLMAIILWPHPLPTAGRNVDRADTGFRAPAGRPYAALAGFLLGVCAVGLYDIVSGDGAFSSLVEFARYTLSGGSSSMQASQPPWWYLARLHQWLPLTALPLLVWGWRSGRRAVFLWIVIPLMVLTLVHHKELRYLQNVIPFLAIAIAGGGRWSATVPAAVGAASRGAGTQDNNRAAAGRRRNGGRDARAPVLLALTILWSAWGVNRLEKRSSSAVAAARAIVAVSGAAVAVEQPWAYGGHLYFGDRAVVDLPIDPGEQDLNRAREAEFLALYASRATPERRAAIEQLGFIPWRGFDEGGRPVVVWRRTRPPG